MSGEMFGRLDTTGSGLPNLGRVNPVLFEPDYPYPATAGGDDTHQSGQEVFDKIESVLSGRFGPVDIPCTADPRHYATAPTIGLANAGWYQRVQGAAAISKIGMHVIVDSGNICVAVYRNSGVGRSAVPAARVATSGSVACPAAGYAEVALGAPIEVYAGDWFYLGADNNTAQFAGVGSSTFVSDLANGWQYLEATFPAPSTAGSLLNRPAVGIILVGVA